MDKKEKDVKEIMSLPIRKFAVGSGDSCTGYYDADTGMVYLCDEDGELIYKRGEIAAAMVSKKSTPSTAAVAGGGEETQKQREKLHRKKSEEGRAGEKQREYNENHRVADGEQLVKRSKIQRFFTRTQPAWILSLAAGLVVCLVLLFHSGAAGGTVSVVATSQPIAPGEQLVVESLYRKEVPKSTYETSVALGNGLVLAENAEDVFFQYASRYLSKDAVLTADAFTYAPDSKTESNLWLPGSGEQTREADYDGETSELMFGRIYTLSFTRPVTDVTPAIPEAYYKDVSGVTYQLEEEGGKKMEKIQISAVVSDMTTKDGQSMMAIYNHILNMPMGSWRDYVENSMDASKLVPASVVWKMPKPVAKLYDAILTGGGKQTAYDATDEYDVSNSAKNTALEGLQMIDRLICTGSLLEADAKSN